MSFFSSDIYYLPANYLPKPTAIWPCNEHYIIKSSCRCVVEFFSFTELEKRYFIKLTPMVVNRLKINSYYALFTNT